MGKIAFEIRNQEYVLNQMSSNPLFKGIVRDIVTDIEDIVEKSVNEWKIAELPFTGRVAQSEYKKYKREHEKERDKARKTLNAEDYLEYKTRFKLDYIIEQHQKYRAEILLKRIFRLNRETYENLYSMCGKEFADIWLKRIAFMKPVPTDLDKEYEESEY